MPKTLLPLKGIKETFERPVVTEIVRDLITWTGLPKNIKLQLPGDKEVMHQPGSSISPESAFQYYDETSRLFITYDDDYHDELIKDTAVFRPDVPHIFFDPTTRTSMRPVYSRNRIVISVRYQATDKGTAERWRDEIRARVAHERHDRYHFPTFSYMIPEEYLVILKEIHRLREANAGYGEDFDTYFDKYITRRATDLTDLAGKNSVPAVRETQNRVNGYFDFDVAPDKPTRAHDGTSFNVQFDYIVTIDKPIALLMIYELLVHNQPLSKRVVDTSPPAKEGNYEVAYSMSNAVKNFWENYQTVPAITEPGFKFPLYDEFVPEVVLPHTLRIFTGLVAVDAVDKRTLINLNDIRPYQLSDAVIRYCQRNYGKLTEYGKSMINVSVYEFEELLADDMFEVDEDLNVKLTTDSDMRKIYHVRISIFTNPLLLPSEAVDDLCSDYDGTYELMDAIASGCLKKFPIKRLGANFVSKASLKLMMQCRYQRAIRFATAGDPVYWDTVMTLAIFAHRKEN